MIPCTAFVRGIRLPLLVFFSILALGSSAGVSPVSAEPILLGLYPPGPLASPAVIETIAEVDTWLAPTGKRVTIAGTFVTVEDNPAYVPAELEGAWKRGYVPFVNFKSTHTTADIADGLVDGPIRSWAGQFALWASHGQRRAFMAPLQEMNGYWNPYYGRPLPFQLAYRRIRQIFDEELLKRRVSHGAVSWVFAANGWSRPGDEFERYYPGPDLVDIVSLSGYNFGGCPGPSAVWDTFDTALKPYLDRVPAMAPGKPIFIGETGTVAVQARGGGDKNRWLMDLFTRVTTIPNLRAIVYLNTSEIRSTLPACPTGADYRLHVPGTSLWPGFWNAMAATPNYVYWPPDSPQMQQLFGGGPTKRGDGAALEPPGAQRAPAPR